MVTYTTYVCPLYALVIVLSSSSVPTASSIEVPETILKKRKQNEKAREERLAAAANAKKVGLCF
jgi:hypothetical protein